MSALEVTMNAAQVDVSKVSVIVPAYNAAATIAAQLRALSEQSYTGDWELIVADNRSTDDTVAVIESFRDRYQALKIVSANERPGSPYARNTAVKQASGGVLAFCDADDVAHRDWLREMALASRDHSFVGGAVDFQELNRNETWRPASREVVNWGESPALDFLPFAGSGNLAVRRSVFDQVGGFDESFRIGGDVEFSWRVQLAGHELYPCSGAIIMVRHRGDMASTWKQLTRYAKAHVYLYRRYSKYGMPKPSLRKALRRVRRILRRGVGYTGLTREEKRTLLYDCALLYGHVAGSLRYRRIYV